ncbi:AB hydrolase superfamily protein [Fusarium oxysporum f. sp. albedinis]|nr:AB hydrolase superfamily protein [Fusarium oxysporum f. sp. albedinis]
MIWTYILHELDSYLSWGFQSNPIQESDIGLCASHQHTSLHPTPGNSGMESLHEMTSCADTTTCVHQHA